MKIVSSIRNIYNDNVDLYRSLKNEVDGLMKRIIKDQWHYHSRVKELESFALKAETGRCKKISKMDDLFASTVVVENIASISSAEKIISEKFNVIRRAPKDSKKTHKSPDSFPFDDVRLYLTLKENPALPPREITSLVFELQIKTFLQHAWAIATHDLVYKGESISWSSSRIAYQVKAMLEHAELSISEAERISLNESILPISREFEDKTKILCFLKDTWGEERLPSDLVRLSSIIYDISKIVKIDVEELISICSKSQYVGKQPMVNISPYAAIFLSIFCNDPDKTCASIKENRKKTKIFVPDEALELVSASEAKMIKEIRISPL